MAKTPRDWTKTGTIVAVADWLRRESGALAVIVMRPQDGALSVDDAIAAKDVEGMMVAHLGPLVEDLKKSRDQGPGTRDQKSTARIRWDDVGGQ